MKTLERFIELIDEPNRSACKEFILDHREDKLSMAAGSATKHQNWPGGYVDHVEEVMNIAHLLYFPLNLFRELPFSLSDALLTLFLHDFEKPWKHIPDGQKFSKKEAKEFRKQKILEYKFELTDEHWNAINYVEGEGDDYHPTERVQGELAAFIHCCDTLSARLWYDKPDGHGPDMSEMNVRNFDLIKNEKVLLSITEFARIVKYSVDDYVVALKYGNSFTRGRHTYAEWMSALQNFLSF